MKSILVTGCNRGIGLGLIKHLAKNERLKYIFATCRDPDNALELQQIKEQNDHVHILKADMKDIDSIQKLAKTVDAIIGKFGLSVLINNAGISARFTRIDIVKPEHLTEHFQVNTIAPILMAKYFHSSLKHGANRNSPSGRKSVIINMSSILGSISKNDQGGFYPYRTSKAALNAATKSMSIDFKDENIIAISMHPGWVKTDLGGHNAPVDVDTSVTGMLKFLETISREHNGKFFDYEGKEIPW